MRVSPPTIERLCERIFHIKKKPLAKLMKSLQAKKSHRMELKRYFQISDDLLFGTGYAMVDFVSILNAVADDSLKRFQLEKTFAHYELEPYDLIVCIKSETKSGKMVLWPGFPSGRFAEKLKAEGSTPGRGRDWTTNLAQTLQRHGVKDYKTNPRFVLPAWRYAIFRCKDHDDALKVFYYLNYMKRGRAQVELLIGRDRNRSMAWQRLKKVRVPIDRLSTAPSRIEAKLLLRDLSYRLSDVDLLLDEMEDFEESKREADNALNILREIKRHLAMMQDSPPPQ